MRDALRVLALGSFLVWGGCEQEIPDSENEDLYEYGCDCNCVCVNHMLNPEVCTFDIESWSCEGECSVPACGTICASACEEVLLEDGSTFFCQGVEQATGTCEEI